MRQNISAMAKHLDMLKTLNLQLNTPLPIVRRKIMEYHAKNRDQAEVNKKTESTVKKCGICGKRIRSKNHSKGNQCKRKSW